MNGGTGVAILERVEQEHDKVLKEFSLLAASLQKMESKEIGLLKESASLEAVLSMLRKDIPDHFELEEKVLFPHLKKLNPDEKGFVEELLYEHKEIRKLIDVVLKDARSAEVQPVRDATSLAKVVEDICAHARKEDMKLLPLARRVLTEAELNELDRLVGGTERT